MKLIFKGAQLRKIVAHSLAAKLDDCRPTFDQQGENMDGTWAGEPERGLWLVGDQGVYLMSNAPFPVNGGESKQEILYAEGINPDVDDFDIWYERKRASFGGDDGCEFIDIVGLLKSADADVDQLQEIEIELSPESMAIAIITTPKDVLARRKKTAALAVEFSKVLVSWLSADEIESVISGENHANDVCDANVAMLEAWEKVCPDEPFSAADGEQARMFDAAWNLADKHQYFVAG